MISRSRESSFHDLLLVWIAIYAIPKAVDISRDEAERTALNTRDPRS